MQTSIVIAQRGRTELTEELTAGLRHWEPGCEIVVVDDGTESGEYRRWLKRTRGLRVERQSGVGPTRAWNRGIAAAKGEFVVLLNNDVRCRGSVCGRLTRLLTTGDAAVAGAAWRDEPELLRIKGEASRLEGRVLEGWCLAFRRSLWEELGGFDETMTVYWSDVDFQLRAIRQAGLAQADVPLRHLGHRTVKQRPDRRARWLEDRAVFRKKWV
ncbi:MAG: glycosyltransferase [Planctomycetaceae bacterium]|nr:glycosyltransferase [Planctomycetaceae bacterium]